jgi:hypothetical protein
MTRTAIKEGSDDDTYVGDLFTRFIEICNKAIRNHSDEFIYKQMIGMGQSLWGNGSIDIAVYDDRPKGVFSLQFRDKHLCTTRNAPKEVEKAWRVHLSYLEKVVANPEKYITHPEKLDLDWLKSRLGS